jgi:hypothetical protein
MPKTASSPINTGKVTSRRELRFASIDDAMREIDAIVSAEGAGKLVWLGNWSTGQTLGHLATWIDFAFDGYPKSVSPPFFIRWILKPRKNRYIHDRMPAGVKIPRVRNGTEGTDDCSTDDGLARCRKAFERLRAQSPSIDNPIFGPLTHDEWIQLNLRHAELHLGFLRRG